MMKKFLVMVFAIIMIIGCVMAPAALAEDAYEATVSISADTVGKGEQVTVSVTFPENMVKLTSVGVLVEYDQDAFNILSGPSGWLFIDSATPNVASGNFSAVDIFAGDDFSGKTLEFVFVSEADAKIGEYDFVVSIDDNNTFDADYNVVVISGGTVSTTVPCPGHSYQSVVTAPTCTDKGYTTYTCSVCNDSYKADIVDALDHSFTNYVSNGDATCTADGTKTAKCDRCDATDTKDDVGSKLGHTPKAAVKENEVEPDCTNPGSYDEVVYCDVCDAEISRTTVPVEALGHTPKAAVKENEVAPGCEVAGSYDNVVYCDVCDAEISRTTVSVDPTGHEWGDWTRVLAPTCSAEGKETRTCKNDATHTQEQAIAIDPTAHKWGDWVVTKAPTCSAPGEKEHVCEYNADHKEPGTVPVDPSAHNYIPVVTEPTCTEKGYTTYTCPHDSDHSYVADYVDAKGHTDAPESVMWNWEGYSRATCTTGCGVCGAVTTEKAVIEVGTSTAKDCTEVGKTTYIAKATVNGVEYTDEKTVEGAAGPHDWSDWTVTTKPTCTEKGEETRVCSHNSDHKETRPVDATGHDYEKVVTAPTCTEKGYTTYTCDACGDTYVADYVDALGHDYEAVVTAPTCTEKGYTTYTCAACGDSYIGDYVDELGHNYESVVTEPTCTEQGYTTYTCAACGDSYVDDYVDELGHTEKTPANCASGAICDVCGEEYGEKDPANHSEIVEVEEEPSTCTTPGTKEHWECKGCGKRFADANATQETDLETLKLPLNPDNHTLVYKYDDNNHWLECADGDYSEKDTGSEPHSMGDWHIITNATSSKDGLKEKYCDTCDYTVQEKIPATGTSGSDKDNSDIPDTGDDAPIALMAAVLTVCAAGVVVLTSRKRKNEN